MKSNKYKNITINIVKIIVIITFATVLALGLDELALRAENIFMLYAIAILIIITETKAFVWGAISAVVCVLTFNFLFTEPRFTFMVNDPNYSVSFCIFLILSFIVSSLATRLNKQVVLSNQNEERINKLYKISSGYLNLTGAEAIISYGEKNLSSLIGKRCDIYVKGENGEFADNDIERYYEKSLVYGSDDNCLSEHDFKYIPVKNGCKTLGVLSIGLSGSDLSTEEMFYINMMLHQITIALENDYLKKSEEINRLNVEKEKLKTNLLRSISHDLRTPLTSIGGNAEFLMSSLDILDSETVKSMLNDIGCDAIWLSNMVENLLNMTRIQDGKLIINTQNEVVDDIVSEAVGRIEKRLDKHTIKVNRPDEIVLINVDGQLMIQVLVNLIDNCIKHTRSDSEIIITAYKKRDMIFEISDDGGGIKNEIIDKIFDSFVTTSVEIGDTHRGVGLGLSIVKSIVEAHGGTISAQNNEKGGATFRFILPLEDIDDE